MRVGCLVAVLGLVMPRTAGADGLFGLFKGKQKSLPSKEQRAAQDRSANALFAQAEGWQKAGKLEKAGDAFRQLVKHYPYAQVAGEAQFREAETLLARGELLSAFDSYQLLITNYRASPRFKRAIEQQFNIATKAISEKTDSFLFIARKAGRSSVVEMFETVIANAPASPLAAHSEFSIGQIYEKEEELDKAIAAYQKVADDYPKSEKAPIAQLRAAELIKKTNKRPDSPTKLPQQREAYEDFITKFPEHESKPEVVAQLGVISEQEAKKSFEVGQFYERKKNLRGAAIYYNDVLKSENSPLKQKARERLAAIGRIDPQALKLAQVDGDVKTVPEQDLLKNQPSYVGPPGPKPKSAAPKKTTKLKPSDTKPKPITEPSTPLPELNLPADDTEPLPSPQDTEPLPSPQDTLDLAPDPLKPPGSLLDEISPPAAEKEGGS